MRLWPWLERRQRPLGVSSKGEREALARSASSSLHSSQLGFSLSSFSFSLFLLFLTFVWFLSPPFLFPLFLCSFSPFSPFSYSPFSSWIFFLLCARGTACLDLFNCNLIHNDRPQKQIICMIMTESRELEPGEHAGANVDTFTFTFTNVNEKIQI